jgi:hypothetical protein
MNTEENRMFKELKSIQKVTPSSTLFSKIENKIKEEQNNTVSMSKLMAASVVLIVLVASNTLIIRKELKQNKSSIHQNELIKAFNINLSNQLYNE